MKIEKNFNGKVSFGDLIQKSREENLPLIDVVKEYTKIHHPSLEEKIVKKSILISNYTKQESIIQGLMTAEITEENVSSINEQINEIRSAQEVMTIFTALNLFNEKIEFDTELENSEVFNQYNILFQEGVFNYFQQFFPSPCVRNRTSCTP
jgi:hemerythrin-like domain-containing protein